MPKIIQLSPHVANLIAAGEVVERPASVVKELLENAVDAGASQITVEIRDGGMTFLRVTDNGCGMSPEDALTAFLPEWLEELDRDFNHPSIVGWCPFNEVWPDPVTHALPDKSVLSAVYYATKAVDPTRPVIDVSGGFHAETDIYDIHDYAQSVALYAQRHAPGAPLYEPFPKQEHYDGKLPMFRGYPLEHWDIAG